MFGMIVYILNYAFDLLNLLILVRILLSWIPHDRSHPLIHIVYDLTDPLFAPFQGRLVYGAMDLSPIAVLFILSFVRSLVIGFFAAF